MVQFPEAVDLAAAAGSGGVVWTVSPDGFHANLVVLADGECIETHRNDELDVLMIVLAGEAAVDVDGEVRRVAATDALVIPRGACRGVRATDGEVRYLTVHPTRGGLSIRSAVADV